ncbi:MAG: hypothetical protein ACRELF_18195, partial [Gemmataceae bacterium]
MTEQQRQKAEESWEHYRLAFSRRSRLFPSVAIFVPLIDRIRELGYSARLFAAASLDNLVISVRPNPRDRQQTILVIPQENTVEFRLYPKDGEVEVRTVDRSQAIEVLDRL